VRGRLDEKAWYADFADGADWVIYNNPACCFKYIPYPRHPRDPRTRI
jgi:hypothetical protein